MVAAVPADLSEEPPSQRKAASVPGGIFGRHFSARPEGSPYPKAESLPRLLARLTDFMLAALLPMVAGEPGGILAVLYLLFADGILRGQSPGKKLLGIKVIHVGYRRDADFRESALRNFPFALAMLLCLSPTWGELLALAASAAVTTMESERVVSDKLGLRLGDLLAGTQVVDTKVLAVQPIRPPVLEVVRAEGAVTGAKALFSPNVSPRQAA